MIALAAIDTFLFLYDLYWNEIVIDYRSHALLLEEGCIVYKVQSISSSLLSSSYLRQISQQIFSGCEWTIIEDLSDRIDSHGDRLGRITAIHSHYISISGWITITVDFYLPIGDEVISDALDKTFNRVRRNQFVTCLKRLWFIDRSKLCL